MYTAEDIKNVKFSTAFKGYKQEEIDAFLDTIEADYVQYERVVNDLKAKIAEYEATQSTVNNVLMNAQKLADQIVADAKEQSEQIIRRAEENISDITVKEKELSAAFEQKAAERKEATQAELDEMINNAQLKAKSIDAAAVDSVNKQQEIFNKLKSEVALFKAEITSKYKEHLTLLQSIPDFPEFDPKKSAENAKNDFENGNTEPVAEEEPASEPEETAESETNEVFEEQHKEAPATTSTGFSIETQIDEE